MAKKILYLSQWFAPENTTKSKDLVAGLVARGYVVEVLTGFPNYPTGKLAPGYKLRPYMSELIDGVKVHRVFLYPSHDRSSARRAANYLSFFFSSLIFCLVRGRRFDAIYVYHPPITVGLAAAVSGLFTRRPFIIEIQDLWPDSVVVSGMAGANRLSRILGYLCTFTYQRAGRIIAQSRGMTQRLIERGVPSRKLVTIFNWADEAATVPQGTYDIRALKFEGRFNIVYAGNLGRVQALDTVIYAARQASLAVPELLVTLIGEGVERQNLAALAEKVGTKNVRLLPGLPKAQIADVLDRADALLVHLKDDALFEITVPSKTQFYMAMGKPILIGVRGEAAEIVVSAKAGLSVPPENATALADAMVQLARMPEEDLQQMGRNGRQAYLKNYSFEYAMQVTAENLEILLGSGVSNGAGSAEATY